MGKLLRYYNQFKGESKEQTNLYFKNIEMSLQMGNRTVFSLRENLPMYRIHLHVYRQELFCTVITYLQSTEL